MVNASEESGDRLNTLFQRPREGRPERCSRARERSHPGSLINCQGHLKLSVAYPDIAVIASRLHADRNRRHSTVTEAKAESLPLDLQPFLRSTHLSWAPRARLCGSKDSG